MGEITQGLEEMLRIGGKLMTCVEELEEQSEGGMGMRGGYRGGYRGGMGYRGRGGYRYPNNGNQPYANNDGAMGERGGYYEDPMYV